MPINKTTQLTATVIDYPYKDKERPVKIPIPLIIESAVYYDPADLSIVLNVEHYLSPMLVNNKLAFVVDNDIFGGNGNDPAPGIIKELRITYSYNNITSTLICKEKATVVLQAY